MSEPSRSTRFRDWPKMLGRVAELIGPELALHLADQCGGLEQLYIPRKPNHCHYWAKAVGLEAFAVLCNEYGGERVNLPRGLYSRLRKRRIITLAQHGHNNRFIALRCRVTERYVRRVLNGCGLGLGAAARKKSSRGLPSKSTALA